MSNEQRGKRGKKTKKCCDCLHCKVYEGSTENCRLCFCSVRKVKAYYQEKHWKAKKACEIFVDMTA